ncbi:acyl-CoA dehydrogenase family protein [Aminobacter sp. MDW-2]|jgi:alkylation response protein AidB-like acyl-CoA dehydrogenase|uniref:acyl-CoA dehydrogenase family protein n=1 Tax=Aminobacter sp. MDW-2 TaxID=2666139 RepID=UPI0012B024EC|nr:acyl-CoA dehydrogenase family protein [Aminobacter sp. MDW-2]MRX37304.1 acyl-CoA dehydrogenase [Aminobacter sp. MDW-2]QNH32670.1 acyl-CoA/acyl-ACP dehydrogenase [Aminobacter sp. MDW-2]
MDFRFSEEQTMTANVVRELLADVCQPADLRRLMGEGAARDEARWAKILEMGLAGALVAEDSGGLGLSAIDFVQIAEACGYAGLPEPLVENAGVALPLLAAFSDNARAAALLERALAGDVTVTVAHPANSFVADADTAEAVLVVRDGAVHLVETAKARIVAQPSVDPFRRLFTVEFEPSDATLVAGASEAAVPLAAALDRGALFAAAQMQGISQRCVDLGVAYAKERQQFGKPIGSYQAVKHHLATAQVKIEFARPVLHAAAAQLEQGDLYSRARISQAKLACTDAADVAARTSIQVHGAMGYSWEVDVHFFLKRGIALTSWWGGTAFHRERVAARVFARPLGPEHTFAGEA